MNHGCGELLNISENFNLAYNAPYEISVAVTITAGIPAKISPISLEEKVPQQGKTITARTIVPYRRNHANPVTLLLHTVSKDRNVTMWGMVVNNDEQ